MKKSTNVSRKGASIRAAVRSFDVRCRTTRGLLVPVEAIFGMESLTAFSRRQMRVFSPTRTRVGLPEDQGLGLLAMSLLASASNILQA
ncbi:hypothetical protein GCM10008955_41910 [Deinococcus malanensis]|uniref:Transposase DDE domain-containing protein n=1 Tax=Deinococcus malanensis TaxID=1706855 RepID=A0ABQ2F2L0_9DEIO|nr:hypothetical protein GCM10008955_41910 [Deinococcus malanensis]